ncbi:MAG TPA: hypothetical protein PKN95_02015 [Verrucomicrobiota bacterium]|nr:hypothetical protein [Verrucomicrobiota bacterium]HNT14042.1 hypothetical protein [Verrucomicrobiota bacterium]
MNPLAELQQQGDCGFFRPTGDVEGATDAERLKRLTQVVALAHARRIPKLVLNLTGWKGQAMPDLAHRYFIMRELARAARGAVKVAFVLPPQLIGEGFGVLVGINAGMMNRMFTTESEALAWLHQDTEA